MKTTWAAFSLSALAISLALSMGIVGTGCATSAAEEQRQAQSYQRNSDAAAKNGQYEVAGQQQRKAQDAQNKAIMKSIDEGKSVPPVSDAPDPGHQPQ
jgi:pectin methylesterase-like acyl-CoA thioesterase